MSEHLIREWIREQLIMEADAPDAPESLEPDEDESELLEPEDDGMIEWESVLDSVSAEDKKGIQTLMKTGPEKKNEYGEPQIVAALNALSGTKAFEAKGKNASYDVECVQEVTINGVTFPKGAYEVKTQADKVSSGPEGGPLARLGQAKAVTVSSKAPLKGLRQIGTAYYDKIYNKYTNKQGELDLEDSALALLEELPELLSGLEACVQYFEGNPGSASSQRWYTMMSTEMAAGTIEDYNKNLSSQLSDIRSALSSALGSGDEGSNPEDTTITVTSDEGTPGDAKDSKEFEFDKITWSADISRFMKSRVKGTSASSTEADEQAAQERSTLKEIMEALQDLWTAIDRNLSSISDGFNDDGRFWENLAQDSQGNSGIVGIFGVQKMASGDSPGSSSGFRYFTFAQLKVQSITQGGRIVLVPNNKRVDESVADVNADQLLREFIREALLTEAFTKTDERQIGVMARKEIDKKWKDHEKKIQKMFDDRDKTLFRNDAFYKVIARIYQELQRAYAEDQFKYATRYTRKDIPLARFRPS